MLAGLGGHCVLPDFPPSLLRTGPFVRVLWVPSPSEQSRRIVFLFSSVGSWNPHSITNHVFSLTSTVTWSESKFIIFLGHLDDSVR